MMSRQFALSLPALVLLGVGASVPLAKAQPVQVITPIPAESTVIVAPTAPPPARVETIPPPPVAEASTMYWQPGHWMWSGANWVWASGQYVQRPAPMAVWQPGHWAQQPTGGYVWVDGHWQG